MTLAHWTIGVLAAAAALGGSAMAVTHDSEPLSRDRQVQLERQIGHLTMTGSERCIQRRRAAELIVISDQRVLFRVSRGLVYDNRLQESCPGLERSPSLPLINARGSTICAGDVVELVDPGRTASCRLGEFTIWSRPE